MKFNIAILFTGKLSVDTEIYNNFISNIQQNHNVDYFVSYKPTTDDNIKKEFFNLYKPKIFIESDELIHDLSLYKRHKYTQYHNYACMLYSRYNVFKHFENYVNDNNKIYDFYILTRCDLNHTIKLNYSFLIYTINYYVFIPEGHDNEGINDRFILGNYNNIKTYCDLNNHIVDLIKNKNLLVHPESSYKYWLEYNNINIQRINLSTQII